MEHGERKASDFVGSQQIPNLGATGSNPVGCTIKLITYGICLLEKFDLAIT